LTIGEVPKDYSRQLNERVNKSRRIGWAGHVAGMEARRDAYKDLMRKPYGKRPTRSPRRRL